MPEDATHDRYRDYCNTPNGAFGVEGHAVVLEKKLPNCVSEIKDTKSDHKSRDHAESNKPHHMYSVNSSISRGR